MINSLLFHIETEGKYGRTIDETKEYVAPTLPAPLKLLGVRGLPLCPPTPPPINKIPDCCNFKVSRMRKANSMIFYLRCLHELHVFELVDLRWQKVSKGQAALWVAHGCTFMSKATTRQIPKYC